MCFRLLVGIFLSSANTTLGCELLGQLAEDGRYERQVSPTSPPYLNDHQVFGDVIVPGAAFLDNALLAATRASNNPVVHLTSVMVPKALKLGTEPRTLFTHVDTSGPKARITVSTRKGDTQTDHLRGAIVEASAFPPEAAELAALQFDGTEVDPPELYDRYRQVQQLNYGPTFRALKKLKVHPEGMGEGLVQPDPSLNVAGHAIHPALTDSAFHVIGAVINQYPGERPAVPAVFRKVWFSPENATTDTDTPLVVKTVIKKGKEPEADTVVYDLWVGRPDGKSILYVQDGRFARINSFDVE